MYALRVSEQAMADEDRGEAPDRTPPQGSIGHDRAAFDKAVAPLTPRLYRFCLAMCRDRAEADDVLQESLVRAWLHADSFEGRSEVFSWLCGIARNQFIEARRTRARRDGILNLVLNGCTTMLGAIFSGGTELRSPEQSCTDSEASSQLLTALKTLPEDFRMVVLMCDIEEMGYEEVAEALGVPIGTVKSRHARGRVRLNAAYRKLTEVSEDSEKKS